MIAVSPQARSHTPLILGIHPLLRKVVEPCPCQVELVPSAHVFVAPDVAQQLFEVVYLVHGYLQPPDGFPGLCLLILHFRVIAHPCTSLSLLASIPSRYATISVVRSANSRSCAASLRWTRSNSARFASDRSMIRPRHVGS